MELFLVMGCSIAIWTVSFLLGERLEECRLNHAGKEKEEISRIG